MRPKVFVSQPIPEPALDMLREVAEVTVFPRLDRNMSEDEWIMAAQRADYLFVMAGISSRRTSSRRTQSSKASPWCTGGCR